MILSALIFPFWTGYQLTFSLNQRLSFKERLVWGFLMGHVLFTWLVYLLSLALGFNFVSMTTALAMTLGTGIRFALKNKQWESDFRNAVKNGKKALGQPKTWMHIAAAGAILLLIFRLASKVAIVKPIGLLTGIPNNGGDLVWHLAQITSFASGNNFPPEDPSFAGTALYYPFLANLFSAVFVKFGAPVFQFLNVQSFVFILITLAALAFYTAHLTKNTGSTPWLGIALLLFNGGLGFVHLIIGHELDIPYLLRTLLPPPYDLTGNIPGQHFHWMNFISALIVPQRTLLFGLPMTLFILCLLWWGIHIGRKEEFIWAGLFAGGLPFFHGHTYISVMIYAAALMMLFPSRKWLYFFLPAVVLALPQWIHIILAPNKLGGALKFNFGWMAKGENILVFWARNLGAFLPIYVLSVWKAKLPKKSRLFMAGALAVFIAANLIQFAPWDWDNIKIILTWYVASIPLVAQFFSQTLISNKIPKVFLTALAFLLTTLSGALTVYRLSIPDLDVGLIYSREEMMIGESLGKLTPAGSVILGGPVTNQITFLAGRKSYAGYPGWLWSHGIDDTWREAEVKQFYLNPKENEDRLKQAGIDYVIFGPAEKKEFKMENWEPPPSFARLFKAKNYEIFRRAG